jgi:hypothetical protein
MAAGLGQGLRQALELDSRRREGLRQAHALGGIL